ncbi:MAG: hypothetical protein NTAFB05_21120 [Nitrobacter sp.]
MRSSYQAVARTPLNLVPLAAKNSSVPAPERRAARRVVALSKQEANNMGFGRGLLLWLIGIPIPLIILIAFLMHH